MQINSVCQSATLSCLVFCLSAPANALLAELSKLFL